LLSFIGQIAAPKPAPIIVARIIRKPLEIKLKKGVYFSMILIPTDINTIADTGRDFLDGGTIIAINIALCGII
jgi:pectin methylesterase-like acyl-CoA thioesterase